MENKKDKSGPSIEMVLMHQAVNFPSADCKPVGAATSTFSSDKYLIEPHPMGVKVRLSEKDKYGTVICAANIKQIFFKE